MGRKLTRRYVGVFHVLGDKYTHVRERTAVRRIDFYAALVVDLFGGRGDRLQDGHVLAFRGNVSASVSA